jgi:lipopolysaccharide transport system ATP-binding protein
METIIKVEHLSKKYALGVNGHAEESLRELFVRGLRKALDLLSGKRRRDNRPSPSSSMWALRDINFEVHTGDTVGIIGRNGAGKSTLLKILARITDPTEGIAHLRGRTRSLLEVGTGFHPELTGRENVFLNAAILGMKKSEIAAKFDEIVAFAEIEKFLDTPVKHYSSGMYLRLAFAVAAHLEPEILIVDEVLAVGDMAFQKKCLGKMGDVANGGRTILFVSHQMNQVRRLCKQTMWIDNGQVREFGPTAEVVSAYEAAVMARGSATTQRGDGARPKAQFQSWEIVEPRAGHPHLLRSLDPVTVKITVQINEAVKAGHHGVSLFNVDNQLMWGWAANDLQLMPGLHELYYTFPTLPLRPGPYSWHVTLWEEGRLIDEWLCLPEMIIGTEVHQHANDQWNGVLNVPCKFVVKQENHEAETVRS